MNRSMRSIGLMSAIMSIAASHGERVVNNSPSETTDAEPRRRTRPTGPYISPMDPRHAAANIKRIQQQHRFVVRGQVIWARNKKCALKKANQA